MNTPSAFYRFHLILCLLWAATSAIPFTGRAQSPTLPKPVFKTGNSARDIPFRLVAQHIVFAATINDSLTVDLILDTGFGSPGVILFDPVAGERLGLTYEARANLGGAGEEEAKYAKIAFHTTLALPGAVFEDQPLYVLEKPDSVYLIYQPDGIVGGTLMGCAVEIDYERLLIHLHDPQSFTPDPEAERFPLTFSYGIPVIEAETAIGAGETLSVTLLVDTGAPDLPLLLFPYSSERIQPAGTTIRIEGEGMRGRMALECGRIPALHLGSFEFRNVVAGFVDEESFGAAKILGQNGMLGNDTMERFTVVFDYTGRQLYLKPNSGYQRVYEINTAGLMLLPLKDGILKVYDVVEDSPAAENGIRENDVIREINGQDVRRMDFQQQREIFSRHGETVRLNILRDSESFNLSLNLRRLI